MLTKVIADYSITFKLQFSFLLLSSFILCSQVRERKRDVSRQICDVGYVTLLLFAPLLTLHSSDLNKNNKEKVVFRYERIVLTISYLAHLLVIVNRLH